MQEGHQGRAAAVQVVGAGAAQILKDLRQLAEEDKGAELGCQFCGSKYRFSEAELTDMIETIKGGKQ